MDFGAALVRAARKALGTPFHHQGRTVGLGLDCIGLVVVSLRDVGMDVKDRLDYARRPEGQKLIEALGAHGAVLVEEIQAGDVLLFRFDQQPQHVALATSPVTMIHSFAPVGRVIETEIGAYWHRRLLGVYRFKRVED